MSTTPTSLAARPLLGLQDLLPPAWMLMDFALSSLGDSPSGRLVGKHRGRRAEKLDSWHLTKRVVLEHARARDLAWFETQLARFTQAPFSPPRSQRTTIPKDENRPEAGTRTIDDPAHFKRLMLLYIREQVEWRAEEMMTDRQIACRAKDFSKIHCRVKGRGPTDQDHVATGIWRSIVGGWVWCVLADLKAAFPLVPKALVLRELRKIGLSEQAAAWVWRLVRIDAETTRGSQVRRYHRVGRGIEQGNPLSAMLMNLALAPVLRHLERNLDVQVFTYMDDIYLMARTEQDAHDAFKAFTRLARSEGFTNVRPLWTPGRKAKGKLSQILDSSSKPIPVLKTYLVDAIGNSLAPQKEAEYRQRCLEDGRPVHRMTIEQVRRATGCMALTKTAMRERTDLMKRSR